MKTLPKNTPQLADLIHSCIDISEHGGLSLLEIIKREKGVDKINIAIVENWLRGLPSACSIPYMNGEIEELLKASGNGNWTVDDYWRWSASRVWSFALHPKAYQ